MTHGTALRLGLLATALAVLGLHSASVMSDPVFTAGSPPGLSQAPLYMRDAVPPLNMLVLGKDHKIYYEAYNDASDLDGDGILDVGYQGWRLKPNAPTDGSSRYAIDYYGYFNSYACYQWQTNRFVAVSTTDDKQCTGAWSGDFLNYATTSRMDALRKVLYGGFRHVDSTTETVLQGAFFPQDAHSWGKEYRSIAVDRYDIRDYTPLGLPGSGKQHLFAVTTVTGNANTFAVGSGGYEAPLFRVLENSSYRVWNWLSMEGPVANNKCFNSSNQRVDCVPSSNNNDFTIVPSSAFQNLTMATWRRRSGSGSPADRAAMDELFNTHAQQSNVCGSGPVAQINQTGSDNNPWSGSRTCSHDNYLTRFEGEIYVGTSGTYQFAIDGDDAVDLFINETHVVGWYEGHGSSRSQSSLQTHSGSITLTEGWHRVVFRHQEASGADNWGLFWRDIGGATSRTDYSVRVQACPSAPDLREATCKTYPSNTHKPTGILHEYGESKRMFFGLITGSQRNNLEGGVLRRNISNFASEIDAETGVFLGGASEGIARSIDRLRMIGGGYSDSTTNNLTNDSNWSWSAGTGNCPAIGGRPINNGECRMWGNPVAEMLYESMRYFAGAAEATTRFATGGASEGATEETTMGLDTATWKDPYGQSEATGLLYPSCAKAYQTVISDINPSYDGDLPGSGFTDAVTTINNTPATISSFNATTEANAIWAAEFGGARNVFIGQVGDTAGDEAPTAKAATTFANIRGLSPEEPGKRGTYYSASVARFARSNDLSSAPGAQSLSTYSIALASPLPSIQFPVGSSTITLLPFAKTVSGTFGESTRKPTNTIVDFYVEEFANFPGQPIQSTVNGGRARAVFRINYEDVEQGNDHDMDAIVRYEIVENAGNTVTVALTSEYASGSANQNIGYIISGTTQDGIYLEVRDADSAKNASAYMLNTPSGIWAGGCVGAMGSSPCSDGLDHAASRTFSPGTQTAAVTLENPLWYAAKYGAPGQNWDEDGDREPDNYFLVTNPLYLRQQLSKAFDDIENRTLDVGNRTVSGARIQSGSFTLAPSFARLRDGNDWTGELEALSLYTDGSIGPRVWAATAGVASVPHGQRNIRTIADARPDTFIRGEFAAATLGDNNQDQLGKLGINVNTVSSIYGAAYDATDFVNYLRGDQAREKAGGGAVNTLRTRSKVLGDIVNSEPVVFSPRSDFGYGNFSDAMFSGYADRPGIPGFLSSKRAWKPVAYVGANDGMLHAFDASTRECTTNERTHACATIDSGKELFGFIPNAALGQLGELPKPDERFTHRYFVDGQIAIGDAKRSSNWRSVLAASMGAGGRSVFALDISDIQSRASFTDSKVLWEMNQARDSDMGHVYGKPIIAPLENGDWAVLFGNGYGGLSSDPILYVVDAFTGEVIRKIRGDDGNVAGESNGLVDWICGVTRLCARRAAPFNGLGHITALDRNGNGKIDTVYGGDLQGNLWKFDLRATNDSSWDVYDFPSAGKVPLFTAETNGERQPITGGIRVSAGPGTGVMVFFGTGRYLLEGDNQVAADPQIQALYGVFDNGPRSGTTGASPAGGRSNLQAQSIASQADTSGVLTRVVSGNRTRYFGPSAVRGWYLDLKVTTATRGEGERFIATPRIQSGKVFFTTYVPDPNNTGCAPGGTNWQYVLDILSGAGSLQGVRDTAGNVVCDGEGCGAVALRADDGSTTMPPVTQTSMVATRPVTPVPPVPGLPACDPTAGPCPTFEQCQVVIYPGAFVLPRPCGRQSWRQLR